MQFAPFPVVIPMLAAALLAALSDVLPRRAIDWIACLVTASVLAVCCMLVAVSSAHGTIVYWFGGWAPLHGFPVGISFVIDPIAAGLAAFVALLVLCAFVFAWYYFESVKSLFHALMLVFLAAMCGLALTGDLFNLFVWFELMSAAGVALCGYKSDETGPLQGAINFAVINTLGAYLSLTGIAILYAQTSALNMAQAGAMLAAQNPGKVFVLIAFVFFASGFLVKAATFPFHFWLADAHAVAPTPVCILFSGVMVELGLYAVARVYWVVFSVPLAPFHDVISGVFLTGGALTALVGGVGCFGQRHLKRLLAFSTISHMGTVMFGFALLGADALAGSAMYVLGHGLVKAALFTCAGILLNRFESVDEFELQGVGRKAPAAGLMMFIGALGLAGVPPFGTFFGNARIDDALDASHLSALSIVMMISGALTAGAVWRASARISLGWGDRHEESGDPASPKIPMKRETTGPPPRTPITMLAPAGIVLLLAVTFAIAPQLRSSIEGAAARMQDVHAYQKLVLNGQAVPVGRSAGRESGFPSCWRELLTAGIAAALALAALYRSRLGAAGKALTIALGRAMHPFRAIHSGRVGDYIAWFVLGVAAYGGSLLLWAQ